MTDTSASCQTLGTEPSFGFGDRIGLATPGHVLAMQRSGHGILPIFPQQSIREMARTNRSPGDVLNDALNGMQEAGWTGPTGGDADHLKTTDDADVTAAAGYSFFTIDPSDHVDEKADGYDEGTLRERFAEVEGELTWLGEYRGRKLTLETGAEIECTEEACLRAGVKYGRAINHAIELACHIAAVQGLAGRDYEIELSVDETDHPTTLAEHYIIADRCLTDGIRLISLAPRFVGDFEKGVDFRGNLEDLDRSLADHAALARQLGPYKLSLHSGSDKLAMYAMLARATRGCYHVKTAGTSYLEALRVAARHDQSLFRKIIAFSRERFETDRATYHLSATLDSAPPDAEISDPVELERQYLGLWSEVPVGEGFTGLGRQILHCTFGSVLTDPALGPLLRTLLEAHQETYTEVLADHFERHLDALQAGLATAD
ncbi:MAG: tagaturonate epimerase family protein [Planctomycetales bacterium]|nr:tagaturonate epimerase family protein [Planctomycetales bacterium]